MSEKMKFVIADDDDNETECEILFTFEKNGAKGEYVVYTDYSTEEDGRVRVFAAIRDRAGEDPDLLLPITEEEDYKAIEQMLEGFQKMFYSDKEYMV